MLDEDGFHLNRPLGIVGVVKIQKTNSGVGHSGSGDYHSEGKGEWRVLQKSSSSSSVLLQQYQAAAVLCRYIGSATCRAIAWIMVQE